MGAGAPLRIRIFASLEQVIQGGFAVGDMSDLIGHLVVLQDTDDQIGMVGIILHQEYFNRITLHFGLPHLVTPLICMAR